MDGWVTVGTKLDTKQLEKDIKSAERRLQQYEKEGEKLANQNKSANQKLSELQEESKYYDNLERNLENLRKKYQELAKEREALKGGQPYITEDIRPQYEQITTQMNEILRQQNEYAVEWEKSASKIDDLNSDIEKQENLISEINQKISENTNQQGLLNNEIQEMNDKLKQAKGYENINKSIKSVSNETSKVIKNVAKWGLAIFGIRSAYNLVKSAISIISQYNEQMATDLEYMRYAIVSSLQKPIEAVIRAVVTLLKYINYIANAWFGINLFASKKDFEDMKKSSSGVAKNAREINKQLASFDEMNILQDTSSSASSSASGGDDSIPSFDLSTWDDIKMPSWVEWIAKNKDKVIDGLMGIAAGLLAVKNGATLLEGLGIGLIFYGIFEAVRALKDYLDDPSWENFGRIITNIGIAILGVGLFIGSLPVAVIGAFILIDGIILKYWEKIKETLQKGIDWLRSKNEWVKENFGIVGEFIYNIFVDSLQNVLNAFDDMFSGIKQMFDGLIDFVSGVFTGNWNKAFEGLKKIGLGFLKVIKGSFELTWSGIWAIIKNVINLIIGGINLLIKGINKIKFEVPSWVPGIGGKKVGFDIPEVPKLAKGGIISQPGRGVPLAFGGEGSTIGSREGVIPLTDSQQMELLGEAIGKYISLNATIPIYVGNRQIARELKRIDLQNDFATNR